MGVRAKLLPHPYLLALSRLGLAPHQAAAVEDSSSGAMSAICEVSCWRHSQCYRASDGRLGCVPVLGRALLYREGFEPFGIFGRKGAGLIQ
jgi:hypothetical protein